MLFPDFQSLSVWEPEMCFDKGARFVFWLWEVISGYPDFASSVGSPKNEAGHREDRREKERKEAGCVKGWKALFSLFLPQMTSFI